MRSDETLLLDMLGVAQKIQRFTDGKAHEDFDENTMAQSAVVREFQVIGKAARMVSDEAKAKFATIPGGL